MATYLETPSRIWRRIEAGQEKEMPSLPSLPGFSDDSADEGMTPSQVIADDSDDALNTSFDDYPSPKHSTPAASSHGGSTIRQALNNSNTGRFSNSMGSKSARWSSVGPTTQNNPKESFFDISDIPSLSCRDPLPDTDDERDENSKSNVEIYSPPEQVDAPGSDHDFSLMDALEPVSRVSTPPLPLIGKGGTPKMQYDYSVSLKSEPKPSPFDKYRNVGLRRSATARTRTPSLSRTTDSSNSSPAASTPKSNKSLSMAWSDAGSPLPAAAIPIPRSASASPAQLQRRHEPETQSEADQSHISNETGAQSMDITDIHISPQRVDAESEDYDQQNDQDSSAHRTRETDDREPTFSSESEPASYATSNRTIVPVAAIAAASPGGLSYAPSSPANSLAMTPTPAFPRPRARFDLPPPPDDLLQTPAPRNNFTENEDLVTPHTRRRSFLLSVINSTARPRIKMGTPHPHKLAPVTPSVAGSTPRTESGESASTASSGSGSAAAPAVRAPFPNVGLTPRPKAQVGRRLSHPLSQAISASSSGSNRKPWGTPAHLNSPYDGANDKASFVSTASSHDLTTHHRVNTSFDPSMGFGSAAQGHGVGRFNANKLNNYLHSLNRRLQEENENLLARMRDMEEEKFVALEVNETGSADGTSSRRSSGVHRRLSVGGALGNVQEDIAEAWLEEKAELEEMVEGFKDEAEKYLLEKEELEKQLELEKEERKRDQERWEDRMREAEQGIEVILTDLNKKLGAAQSKADKTEERAAQQIQQAERDVEEMRNELDVALDRATKAERLLESGKDLGGALKEANDRVVQVMNDLRNSNAQIKELEREVIRADHRIEDLEKDLREDKDIISNLEADLAAEAGILKQEREKAKTLEAAVHDLENEVDSTKEYVTELEEGAGIAMEQIEKLESDLSQAHSTIEAMNAAKEDSFKMIKDLEADLERLRDLNRQLEDAIDETEKKNSEDDEHINELQSKISSLERERDKFRQLADNAREPSVKLDSGPTEEDLEALEKELDDAHKEIARLSTLLSQSPARKAMDMARDTKLEMLEREKEELLERNKALRMTLNEFQTPHKVNNSTMISPIHRHVLNLSMKAPRTPGAPLRDMSWLNSTMNDPSVSPLIAEIHRLQQELEVANESIDDKLDKLEDAGMGVVGLTKKLEDARARISRLEDEVARLSRKEDRFVRRLSRTRCKKCNVKVDMSRVIADESSMDASPDSMMSEPPTPPTRTTEALKAQLQAANASLEHLREEMEELQADNKRLGGQIRNAKAEVRKVADGRKAGDKARNGIETELDRAKQTISHLEDALANERSKLRALSAEHDKAEKEKKHVLNDMQRTESDMEDVKDQLQKLKRENQELEKELRQNSTAEQKARLLETKVAENLDTIAQLRNERSLLSSDHKELQRRYSALSETVSRIREERAVHSTSHDVRKHKLDLQVLEIEELKQALESRSEQLHRAKQEKERIASEKSDVARTVASLEADLRRVRRDAEAFGHDLKILRAEKESLEAKLKEEAINGERTKKQSSTQVKLLNEQVESQKRKLAKALQEFEDHACTSDEHQVSTLKLQHNKECKGLMVQIRYLKAKYTRESSFRSDLTYQKDYLLVLLKQFEKSERNIVASIARIGFPAAPSRPKHGRKLKSVAIVVVFLNRTRKGKDEWKQQTAARASIQAALEDVRRRRALPSSSS